MKNAFAAVKPKDFTDLVKSMGFAHGTGTWTNNAELLLKQGHTAKELISSREDIMLTLMGYGIDRETAYALSEYVRFGKANRNGFSDEQFEIMNSHGVPDWYIESMKRILYLWNKSYCAAVMKHTLQCVWFKINYPTEFYAASLSCNVISDFHYPMITEGRERIEQVYSKLKDAFKNGDDLTYDEQCRLEDKRMLCDTLLECFDREITFIYAGKSDSGSVRFIPENGNIKMYL